MVEETEEVVVVTVVEVVPTETPADTPPAVTLTPVAPPAVTDVPAETDVPVVTVVVVVLTAGVVVNR